MTLKTVGDLMNLPKALMNQMELKSQMRAEETAARLLGNPSPMYPMPDPNSPYGTPSAPMMDNEVRKLTQHFDEI